MKKNKLSFILKFIVSFGLLGVLGWIMRGDIKDVLVIISDSDKTLLIIALSMNIPLGIALAYRLKLLMKGQNINMALKNAVYLTFIGFFFNNFLPTAIGGDIAKMYYASKKTNNKVASFAAVITDRLMGFTSTLSIALIGLMLIWKDFKNSAIQWLLPIIAMLSVIGAFMLFNKNHRHKEAAAGEKGLAGTLKEKFLKLYTAINSYKHSPMLLIKTFSISIFLQGIAILGTYFFVLCLGADIQFSRLCLIIPLVWTVSMLPSLNGLGVREGAFVYFLKGHIGSEKALAVSILWLGSIMLNSLIGGVLHLLHPVKIEETKCIKTPVTTL